MTDWVRVKDKRTGHEYSVKNPNKNHEVLSNKPAAKSNGKPLAAKPQVKSSAKKSASSAVSQNTSGGNS